MNLGNSLFQARKKAGLSQEMVAELHHKMVLFLENGLIKF